jgi:DNA-binding CsgD family transcriptional regulator
MNCDTGVVLDVLDAAYRLELADKPWLRGLAASFDRALGDGSGTIAMEMDMSGPSRVRFDQIETLDVGPWWQHQLALFESLPIETLRTFGAGPVFYFSQVAHALLRHDPATATLLEQSALELYGAGQLDTLDSVRAGTRKDALIERLVLSALDPFGSSVGVMVPLKSVARRAPARRELAIWGRVVAHLAAAHRLRTPDHPIEAVLSPGGKVLDATGPARAVLARDALRAAALGQDRARSRRGRGQDAESVTEQWQAVVSGRWTLVDQFESDGRRYLVARVNERDTPRMSELSEHETHVVELAARGYANKQIAYELGISIATVARRLASASAKLGATSRVELIRRALREPR